MLGYSFLKIFSNVRPISYFNYLYWHILNLNMFLKKKTGTAFFLLPNSSFLCLDLSRKFQKRQADSI